LSTLADPIVATDLEALRASISERRHFDGQDVVVTGGAGFIGSWLCDFLTMQGARVTCLDDTSTGLVRNVSHLMQRTQFKFVNCDVTRTLPKIDKCNFIFHLASHPSPEEYQEHPVETIVGNSQGTLNMLQVAKKNHAALLLASSSEVYGDAQVVPTPETYWGNVNPIGPRSCYDEGKRFSEALCMAYHRAYGLDVRLVRIFNTYGPRLRADGLYARALSRFIKQALSESDLTVYGKGDQTRSFCYITDTARALLLASTKDEMNAQVLNVGNPEEIPILSLANAVIKAVGSHSKITYRKRPIDDPQRRCPDISRARALLSWAPHVSLEQGLSNTVKWFRANSGE